MRLPYSVDLRSRVIAALKDGMNKKMACEIFSISKQTIYNWLILQKERGTLDPITDFQNGHSHGIKDLDVFREYVDAHPDYTQEEFAEYFKVGSSTIGRTLAKIGYTRKKRVKPIPKEAKKNAKLIKQK